jgi:hypothetical protein
MDDDYGSSQLPYNDVPKRAGDALSPEMAAFAAGAGRDRLSRCGGRNSWIDLDRLAAAEGTPMKSAHLVAIVIAGTAFISGSVAVLGWRAPVTPSAMEPVWTEVKWPFLMDQWGIGKAFACMPQDCGSRLDVYVRPKIGFCNCATGVSDDRELERIGDTDLVSPEIRPLGPGHSIKVGWMAGQVRAYRVPGEPAGKRLLSIAFNDECDVVVAVALLGNGDPAVAGSAVMGFLDSRPMVLWAKKELGLEFVSREW